MATRLSQPHFVLFPFMAQGHMIPMIDIARLLSRRGVTVTIVTTPANAARFESTTARCKESGLQISQVHVQFPCAEAGLPEGCDNMDLLPSLDLALNFYAAANMVQDQVEKLFETLTPRPNCIISDLSLPYTCNIAAKFNVPRISFHGVACFCLLCTLCAHFFKDLQNINSEHEYFVLPGLPGGIEFTKAQLPIGLDGKMKEFFDKIVASDLASFGMIINTFEELEVAYVEEYKKVRGGKVWCIGPVSLCNEDKLDKAQRGSNMSLNEHHCLEWLDSRDPSSVVYVCLGSLCNLITPQLIELALGLEASQKPFIWVVTGRNAKELENWIEENGYEERIKGRGVLVHGWAPQVLILSHQAIGGFLTHCGWNSTLEGITSGVPLLTWPLFGDQFVNEKLVVQVLGVGVRIGVDHPINWGKEEEIGVLVKREGVRNALDKVMDGGKEGRERRERAKELAEIAKRAVEDGGSSDLNLKLLISDVMENPTVQRR